MSEEKARYELNPEVVKLTEETMRGDLIDALLTEIKAARDVWQKLSQSDQDIIIGRLDNRVTAAVREAVRLIAAAGRSTVKAKLDQLTAKDGIKAVLSLSQHDAQRHALLDAVGRQVLVVVADADGFMGGETPAPDPDQPALSLAAQEPAGGGEPAAGAEDAAQDAGVAAADEAEAEELAEQRQDEGPAWVRDDGRIYEAILLIDEDWTGLGSDEAANLAAIASWSDEEAEAVENFCNAVHLQIMEPAKMPVLPIRPDCIGGPLPGQVADPNAPDLPL